MTRLIALALLLSACAPTIPYTTERNVTPLSRHWASGTGSATKALTVHNPMDTPAIAKVFCNGDVFEGESERYFVLAPVGQKMLTSGGTVTDQASVMVQVPAAYQVGSACAVTSYEMMAPDELRLEVRVQ